MKQKHSFSGQSGFWVKLLGVLVAVGIVVVLIFGGVQNVMSRIMDLQRQFDKKTIEFDVVSGQLAEANQELGVKSRELETTQVELEDKSKELELVHSDFAKKSIELAETRSQLEATVRQLSNTENDLSSTQNKLVAKVSELENVQGDLVALSAELADTATELVERDRDLRAKADVLTALDSQLTSVKSELDAAKIELDAAKSELTATHHALGQKTTALESSQRQLATTSKEAAEAKRSLGKLEKELALTHSEVDLLQNELGETQREFATVEKRFAGAKALLEKRTREFREETGDLETRLWTTQIELEDAKDELQVAYIMSAEIQTELTAYLAAQGLVHCYVYETVGLAIHLLDDESSFSTDQTTRYQAYVDFLLDGGEDENPIQEFCSNFSTDWATSHGEETGMRARIRAQNELNLSSAKVTMLGNKFIENGLGTPEETGERTAELGVDAYANAEELILRMLGTNAIDRLADALVAFRIAQ